VSTVSWTSDESESFNNRRNDVAPFDHCADANVAARETLGNRSNNIVPNHISDSSDVLRSQRMLVHERVHRRVNVCRGRRGQCPQQRYDEIVADAVGDLGEGICRARCDKHHVGPAAKLNVQNGITDAIVRLRLLCENKTGI